jgi:hypothetical protein
MSELYVYAPQLDWFDATFAADAVTYENNVPECARYSVRIDLKLSKAFAVRERKTAPSAAPEAIAAHDSDRPSGSVHRATTRL